MSEKFIDPNTTITPSWQRTAGLLSLLGAAVLTVATALVLFLPEPEQAEAPVPTQQIQTVVTVEPTIEPTNAPQVVVVDDSGLLPTVSAETIAALLNSESAPAQSFGLQVVRNSYDPFTIIPDRPRNEVIEYTVVEGDTIYTIAERYGLQPETIAWSNDRSIIGNLRPGRVINIMPVDGVYHTVIGSRTIADIAADYSVSDPYVIIDSEFNDLFGVTPDTVLPSGTQIAIPGGIAEQISWNPVVEREGGDGTSGGNFVSFSVGDPGSCGRVQNVGGTGWASPISSYTFIQPFSSFHTGVDLAAPVGTAVNAANGGVVIFAGWSNWGYGNAIVLSHGPFTTVYGHLSSINVGCGQVVSAGQVIGGVGSSGNSSGPHLHFEIRYLDVPQNPTATIPF